MQLDLCTTAELAETAETGSSKGIQTVVALETKALRDLDVALCMPGGRGFHFVDQIW